jgi:CheY-like chemotaxis protein
MRILIADNEVSQVLNSQMLTTLAKYGSVDIVPNDRDTVLTYVNNGSKGAFHNLIILDQNLTVLDGFATVDMIRFYESEHRKSGKRTLVYIIASDDRFTLQYENRFSKDERTHLLHKPVNPSLLVSLAGSVAAESGMKIQTNFVPLRRTRQPLKLQA